MKKKKAFNHFPTCIFLLKKFPKILGTIEIPHNQILKLTQHSTKYSQLHPNIPWNYNELKFGSVTYYSVKIKFLKAWHDVTDLKFIIHLIIFKVHFYLSLFHVLYFISILTNIPCIIQDLGVLGLHERSKSWVLYKYMICSQLVHELDINLYCK